ncbi:hypothetical protein RhiirA4_394949, partial [Rhizophagus irregularis]
MDDNVLKLLVCWVAKDRLEKNKIDLLSIEGVRYLLMKTIDTKESFATPEIEIWEYALTKAKTYDQQKAQEYLTSLARYINLNRMDIKEIRSYVEPYNIYSNKDLKDAYYSISSGGGLGFIRGVLIFKWKSDNPDLIISKYGFTVESKLIQPKSV